MLQRFDSCAIKTIVWRLYTRGEGVLRLRTYREVHLENLKKILSWSQIPVNDTLSRSKIFKDNTLSLSSVKEISVLHRDFFGNLLENAAVLPSKSLSHTCVVQMALHLRYIVICGPCHGASFWKMIPCPEPKILKMISCPAARPCMEKYISAPPPTGCTHAQSFKAHKKSYNSWSYKYLIESPGYFTMELSLSKSLPCLYLRRLPLKGQVRGL